MIELEGVSKRYGGPDEPAVLDRVALAVEREEVVVVSGASGVGKTTLLRLVYAADRPDTGSVRVFGRDIARLRRSSIALLRRHVGAVPQEISLFDDRSAVSNVALTLEVRGESRRWIRERALGALELVGLAAAAETPVRRLSTGQRRRVCIARALVGAPDVIVADEPTNDLDSGRVDQICCLFEEFRGSGRACLVTSNDSQLLEAAALCGWRHLELRGGWLHAVDRGAAAEVVAGEFDVPDEIDIDVDEDMDDGPDNVVPLAVAAGSGGSE